MRNCPARFGHLTPEVDLPLFRAIARLKSEGIQLDICRRTPRPAMKTSKFTQEEPALASRQFDAATSDGRHPSHA